MPIIAVLAPYPKYFFTDRCGRPAAGGKIVTTNMYTGLPQPTYSDPSLTISNGSEVGIGFNGFTQANLYWAVDTDNPQFSLYMVTVYDRLGNKLDEIQNFPYPNFSGGGSGPITVTADYTNQLRNEQFAFWNRGISFDNDTLPIGVTEVADTWYFERSNVDAVIEIQKVDLSLGNTEWLFSPTSVFQYTVTTPAPDATQDLYQPLGGLRTLSNEIATFALQIKTPLIGNTYTVSVYIVQNCGVGGSPTVYTALGDITVTSTVQQAIFITTVPSVASYTEGTDAFMGILYRFNPEQAQSIQITDVKAQIGQGTGINYPFVDEELQYSKILPNLLVGPLAPIGATLVGYTEELTVRDALDQLFTEKQFVKNLLIGWNFPLNPRQLGLINDQNNLFAPNNDAVFVMDRTLLYSDGNDIVSISPGTDSSIQFNVVAGAAKFGVLQVIEQKNCQQAVTAGFVSVRFNAKCSSTLGNIKVAVIQWTGAANSADRNLIASWNADDTPPTLGTNWTYLANANGDTFGQILTTDSSDYIEGTFEGVIVTGPLNNLCCFVWSDTTALLPTQTLNIEWVQMNVGELAGVLELVTIQETYEQCQRYMLSSFGPNNPVYNGDPLSPTYVEDNYRKGLTQNLQFSNLSSNGTNGTLQVNLTNVYASFPVARLINNMKTVFFPSVITNSIPSTYNADYVSLWAIGESNITGLTNIIANAPIVDIIEKEVYANGEFDASQLGVGSTYDIIFAFPDPPESISTPIRNLTMIYNYFSYSEPVLY